MKLLNAQRIHDMAFKQLKQRGRYLPSLEFLTDQDELTYALLTEGFNMIEDQHMMFGMGLKAGGEAKGDLIELAFSFEAWAAPSWDSSEWGRIHERKDRVEVFSCILIDCHKPTDGGTYLQSDREESFVWKMVRNKKGKFTGLKEVERVIVNGKPIKTVHPHCRGLWTFAAGHAAGRMGPEKLEEFLAAAKQQKGRG